MRILKLIFSATIFFVITVAIGFFSARGVLLHFGTSKIKKSFKTLSLSRNHEFYASECRELGSVSIGSEGIVRLQLRFLSSKEYILEAVCNQFSFDPILIGQDSLPNFVTKMPGSSGFILNSSGNNIKLQVFADEIEKLSKSLNIDLSVLIKTESLISNNGIDIVTDDNISNVIRSGPVTSCGGYGYECCQEISQVGVGGKITGLVDCEETCYSSCATRPIILSFNTSPIFEPRERSLTVSSGDTVEFTYVADAGEATTVGGVLDFGDGKKLPVTGLAGQSSHTYSCSRSRCEYTVQLILEDNWGIESFDTNISKIKILVGS